MKILRKARKIIDTINEFVGKIGKYVLLIILATLVFEVVSRYVFNSPTIWVADISTQALAALGALGGGYALLYNQHVRVDVFYGAWSDRLKGIVDIITSILFFTFTIVLFLKSLEMCMDAWNFRERSSTTFAMPLWYIKTLMPIGTFLLLIQGIAKLLHDITAIATGKSEDLKTL
ncbi:MAG: TRAP transporter small permease subunit [Firmicutes bacterium]|nr:TRAP transporter small permease subunit [Bacillota bacterium]